MSREELSKGPLTREEYEERHKALQDKYETFSGRVYRALAVFFVGLLLTGGAAAYLIGENTQRTEEINDSLVDGCAQNGEPLRAAVRKVGNALIEQTQRSINESIGFEKTGLIKEFLPNFTPEERHALAVKSRENYRETKTELSEAKAKVKPVNCEARYPSK
jgi:hypothetical protein